MSKRSSLLRGAEGIDYFTAKDGASSSIMIDSQISSTGFAVQALQLEVSDPSPRSACYTTGQIVRAF